MAQNKPNILFITADQWRGDCLGAVGHPVLKTPNIDALAQAGTLFRRHYAAAAPCSPARAAMYSGLWQMNNRVVANGAPMDHNLDNMAKAARRAGYLPTLFGFTDITADPRVHDADDPALRSYEGVLPGFEVEQPLLGDQLPWKRWLRSLGYDETVVQAPFQLPPEAGTLAPNSATGFAAEHSQPAYLTGRLIEWLDSQSAQQSWFAHLSLINPHPPFAAPAPFNAMYTPEDGPEFLGHEAELEAHPIYGLLHDRAMVADFLPGQPGRLADLTTYDLRRIRAVYYGMISEVDVQIGRLMAALKAANMWDNTLIILTSDHAEMMGDHGLLGKGGFFPQSQHIPLIMRLPGAPAGQSCNTLTSAVDLFPTMLDVMQGTALNTLDGLSLLPQLHDTTLPTRDAVFWEFDFRDRMPRAAGQVTRAFARQAHMLAHLTDEYLQIRSPSVPDLLFDLATDPDCSRNVLHEPQAQALRLRAAEALISARQQANIQTLCNLRASDTGMTSVI